MVVGSLSAGSSHADGAEIGSGGGLEALRPRTVGSGVPALDALGALDALDVGPVCPVLAGWPAVDLPRCVLVGLRHVVVFRFFPCRRLGTGRHGVARRRAVRRAGWMAW